MREKLIKYIFEISKEPNAFDKLEKYLSKTSKKELSNNIIECGILPEMFGHDSSEEKLWAKLSDIVLSQSLNYLGIKSEVLGARGNSADVIGKTKNYSIVGDAKTFRLSRTAKNQKDFKVHSLDLWRREESYALLVAPLIQYPNVRSAIYSQAVGKNVTLLSYTHLYFLLDHYNNQDLKLLWETGMNLNKPSELHLFNRSLNYWSSIDNIICQLMGTNISELIKYKKLEIKKTKEIGLEGIKYWNDKIKEYSKLSKTEAIRLLIKSEKIEAKIRTIERAIKIDLEYEI